VTYPCPYCHQPASPETGCPSCGRAPDPDAIEVMRADAEIAELNARLGTARQAVREIEGLVGQAWQRRHAAAARVHAAVLASRPVAAPARAKEASTRLMQNTLFLLGGLLLAIAAIVFTAVAWAQFGVGGRATLLALFTGALLAVPPLVLRRGLTATAETFAAVGLLLVLLDGYAAWYVNLFGVADGSAWGYAGAVCAVTGAIAAGYEHLTGLTGPRYAALLVCQPVLPLLVAAAGPDRAGWALTFAAVAALDLVVLRLTRSGLALAAGVCGGASALVVLGVSGEAVSRTLDTALPCFGAAFGAAVPSLGWPLPAAVVLLAAAVTGVVPAAWRRDAALGGAALLALVLPAGLHLVWWTAPILDLLVVGAVLVAARRPAGAVLAALLGLHAVAVAFGRPEVAAGVFGAVAALGFAAAAGPRVAEIRAAGLVTGLLALPAAAWTTAAAFGATGTVQARIVLAVSLALAGAGFVLGRLAPTDPSAPPAGSSPAAPAGPTAPPAGSSPAAVLAGSALLAALAAVVPLPLWALLAGDSPAIYAALGLLGVAVAGGSLRLWQAFAALPLAAALLAATAGGLARILLLEPYAQAALIWAGPPGPVPHVPVADAVAAGLLVIAAAWHDRRLAVPVAAVAAPLALAAAGLAWPAVPATELLLGLALLLAAALRPASIAPAAPAASAPAASAPAALRPASVALPVVGGLLALPGLGWLLATRASTAAGLGAVLIVAAVAGAAGRTVPARVAGWVGAVAAAAGLALTADVGPRWVAFPVLAVAAAAAALAWVVLPGRPAEARATEAAGHAAAVLALLLTTGSAGRAAVVCALWGLVAGMRALRPAGRSGYLVAAAAGQLAAWFLVLARAEVTLVEAYTIPAAAVALLAGLLARRRRAGLSSWAAYGPALAAAMLPSLASILADGSEGQYLRRLLLGSAALAVVAAGAVARLRAPVLLGGGVLTLVALHELAQVWDLIPRWIPLAAGGLLLVLLATTLERRRRDLDRFRAALHRMS